jgi:hypothetical protein
MSDVSVGMKIYDNDWFLKYGLSPEAAADRMVELGVGFVITQSRYMPMADSAVPSAVPAEMADRYAELDDLAFRRALAERGIDYFACMNVGFDPEAARMHPEWLPIDQHGVRGDMVDWYVGIAPDRDAFVAAKAEALEAALHILKPDGVHLGFVRWPGFWETWLPENSRADLREFSFDDHTLEKFNAASGEDVPLGDPVRAAAYVAAHCREAFTAYKCEATRGMMARLRASVHRVRPTAPIAINTLPFFATEFDGAVTEVLGQDVRGLRDVVDIFEVMAYHQILKRDARWPAQIARDIADRASRRVMCTLQSAPHYLSGMHAGRGRAEDVTADEIETALLGAIEAGLEAVCFFTFADFLDPAAGARKAEVLRHHFSASRRPRLVRG